MTSSAPENNSSDFNSMSNKSDVIMTQSTSAADSSHQNSSGLLSLHYEKLSPYDFLNTMDWKLFSQYCNDNFTIAKLTKRTEMLRILMAFEKLYKEYEFVCESCLPKNNRMQKSNKKSEIENTPSSSSFLSSIQCKGNNKTNSSSLANNYGLTVGEFDKYDATINPSIKSTNSGMSLFQSFIRSCRKEDARSLYDRLFRFRGNALDVYSFKRIRQVTEHQFSYDLLKSDGHLKAYWTHVPLLLELLLPRLQAQIEIIKNTCPFVRDPLEIASELRFFNYEISDCIAYFQETKHLRSIVDEFLPRFDTTNNVPLGMHVFPITTEDYSPVLLDESLSLPPPPQPASWTVKSQSTQTDFNDTMSTTSSLNMINESIQTNLSSSDNNRLHEAILQFKEKQLKQINEYKKIYMELTNNMDMLLHYLFGSLTEMGHFLLFYLDKMGEKMVAPEDASRYEQLSLQIATLKDKLREEERKRRDQYNLMQEQLGNIRVYCRCRAAEDSGESALKITGSNSLILMTPPCEEYKFDKVFPSNTSQAELFEEFRPLVDSFMDGYNVCFITYGSEASGKTFTLIGNEEKSSSHGLIHRSLETVLKEQKLRSRDWSYHIDASCLEIYNDSLSDFISEEKLPNLCVDSGLEHVHEKLQKVDLKCQADIDALVKVCRLKRRVAKTALNPASSRSHLIILIRLVGKSRIHGQHFSSFLGLCDLAGFEDVIKAETQSHEQLSKEAGYINKSLTAFNRMFVMLQKKDPNMVSYRDSKLTHVLKGFLTNSGKCCLIIMVREDKGSVGSTQSTLRFGRETRGVTLGKAKKQFHPE